MIGRLALAMLLLLPAGTALAEPALSHPVLDQALLGRVTGAALAFMTPRTMTEISLAQLGLWALRGLGALDPRLLAELAGREIRLSLASGRDRRVLLVRGLAADADATAWGTALADLVGAGWANSTPLRRAGGEAVIAAMLDEICNHLDAYSRYVPPRQAARQDQAEAADPVRWRRAGSMVRVRMGDFAPDAARHLAEALRLGAKRGVILDLRGNRGGRLREALAAAETLLADGLVAVTVGRHPQSRQAWQAAGQDLAPGTPVIVLVDGGTASAAEVLAAALADNQRAVVVGSATFGKGLVQAVGPLPNGGELLISWSQLLAPRGWPIQGLGVLPQVCTSLGAAQAAAQLAALDRGEQPMAAPLARHHAARPPAASDETLAVRATCPASQGRDGDLAAAQFLLRHPRAYAAAMLPAPPS